MKENAPKQSNNLHSKYIWHKMWNKTSHTCPIQSHRLWKSSIGRDLKQKQDSSWNDLKIEIYKTLYLPQKLRKVWHPSTEAKVLARNHTIFQHILFNATNYTILFSYSSLFFTHLCLGLPIFSFTFTTLASNICVLYDLPISYTYILFEGDLKYESPCIAVFSNIILLPLSHISVNEIMKKWKGS
jgi:hypothetical protein